MRLLFWNLVAKILVFRGRGSNRVCLRGRLEILTRGRRGRETHATLRSAFDAAQPLQAVKGLPRGLVRRTILQADIGHLLGRMFDVHLYELDVDGGGNRRHLPGLGIRVPVRKAHEGAI